MTEDQIDRAAERAMDRLDRQLLSGALSQAEYDEEVRALDRWAREQYRSRNS